MTGELSPPAPPPPETVDQALALLLKAMKESEPNDEEGLEIAPSMTHLDRLAWCHQVAGEALQLAAQTRAALFRRRRNAFIPFNRLPSEVLSAILLEAVDESQPLRIKALQVLAQVAWQWWQTIKSDSQFWAYITPPVEGVELQLRKAGALPLRLAWSNDTDPDAFKDIIQRHARRWTSINFNCHGEDAGLQALCTSHFPRLRYLKVHPSPWIIRGDLKFNISQCQSLQEAHLPIMPYFSASLSSTSPMHLRTLHLDLRSMESHSSQDLELLLRFTPQLVELKVENSFDDTSPRVPVDAPIIDLPKLRHLEFANIFSREEEEWIPLLAQIRASGLENLGLHYNHSFHRWAPDIARRTIFTVLVTLPCASMNRLEDAPLHAVLRNAGPYASWRVEFEEQRIVIKANGSGKGQLDISMVIHYEETKDTILSRILLPPPTFELPVDLYVIWWDETMEPEFWDEVLGLTPLLRSVTLGSPLRVTQQVMDRLSTKLQSPSSSTPRAPNLEKLCFQHRRTISRWSEGDEGEAVKTMLDKRRGIFIQGGVQDPPKLAVTGPNGLTFDEAEGRWLGSESSDAGRGLGS